MNSSDSLLVAEIDDLLELLRLRVLRFRHQLEIAEARVPRWNQVVQQFWQAGLLPQTAILIPPEGLLHGGLIASL